MPGETQYSEGRNCLAVRYGILGGSALALALVIYGFVRYPAAFTLSPLESIFFLALFSGLISTYAWLSMRRTRMLTTASEFALRWGGWLGLVLGLCWLLELWAGNLADPSTNALVMGLYRGSTLAVPALTLLTTLIAARRTGLSQTGIWAGLWSGIISALITFCGLMCITYFALPQDVQTASQAASQGLTNVVAFGVAEGLAGAINHLWIGPLLGLLFGALGGLIGAEGLRKRDTIA